MSELNLSWLFEFQGFITLKYMTMMTHEPLLNEQVIQSKTNPHTHGYICAFLAAKEHRDTMPITTQDPFD
jgi:hypothetical protein